MTAPAPTRARQPRLPGEVRRQQVLDAALRLIADGGYGAATMEAIAREVGVAKPVVYHAFPGIGPLLEALLVREEAKALAALAGAFHVAPDSGPAKQLSAWLRSLAQAIATDPLPWRLMLTPAADTPPAVQAHVAGGRATALAQVRLMTDGLLDRRDPAGLDRDLLAHTLMAAAERAAALMIEDPDAYPPERLVAFADGLLEALLGA